MPWQSMSLCESLIIRVSGMGVLCRQSNTTLGYNNNRAESSESNHERCCCCRILVCSGYIVEVVVAVLVVVSVDVIYGTW